MKDRAKRKAAVLLPPPRHTLDLRFLSASLATEHFRAVCDTSNVYSLPAHRVAEQFQMQPLRQHLQSQPLPTAPTGMTEMSIDVDDTSAYDFFAPEDEARFQGISRRRIPPHVSVKPGNPS